MGHIQGRIGLFTTSWHTPRLTGVRAANGFSVRMHSQACPEHGCLQGLTRERSRHCSASRRFARRADFANVVDLAPGAGIGCEPAPGTRLRPGCASCRKERLDRPFDAGRSWRPVSRRWGVESVEWGVRQQILLPTHYSSLPTFSTRSAFFDCEESNPWGEKAGRRVNV